MNVEEARVHVTERLGPSWLLARVDSQLVPGPTVGAPTVARITVELDYYPYSGATNREEVMPTHRQMLAMLRDREVFLGVLVLGALAVGVGLLLYVVVTL